MKKATHSMSDPILARARRSDELGATFSGQMSRDEVMAKCMAIQAKARKAQGLPVEIEASIGQPA